MTESDEQEVLIGDRGLMAYTDRARTTVRDWHQRTQGALPYTTNHKGHKLFQIAEVDQWLVSRPAAQTRGPDVKHLRLQFIATKERVRELEQELSELKTTKTITLDRVGHFFEARENFRSLVSECRKQMPDATDANLLKVDEFVVDFFNKVQAYLKLNTDTAQNNQVISG